MSLTYWEPPSDSLVSRVRTVSNQPGSHAHLGLVSCAEPLSADRCTELCALGRECPQERATVVGEDLLTNHRVGYVHLIPNDWRTHEVYSLLWSVARDAAERHYRLAVSGITRMPHYVEYHAGFGHFHWHDDYSHEREDAPRKLTVVIQLSDGHDYEGGDFEVFGARVETAPRTLGSIYCLPSFVPHRVTPVTAGVRAVLVAWIAGPRLV